MWIQRIQFKIAISAFNCVREQFPALFNNVCIPVAGISGRANLCLAERHDILVPSTRTQLGRWSFPAPCCAVWNALHHSSAHHPLVVDSLELRSKPVSSHRPIRTFGEERIILQLNFYITLCCRPKPRSVCDASHPKLPNRFGWNFARKWGSVPDSGHCVSHFGSDRSRGNRKCTIFTI